MLAGDVAVLPAGMDMMWRWEAPVQSLHVSVDPAVVGDLLGEPGEPRVMELPAPFVLRDAFARQQLEALRAHAAGGGDPLRVETILQRLLLYLSAGRRGAVRPPKAGLPPARLSAVLEWLEEHLDQRVSVHDLAATAGVESSWFSRLFTLAAGQSPYQYLLERRVVRAQHLLSAGEPPASVASACGFVDQAHLARHFRRIVGATPAAWARSAAR